LVTLSIKNLGFAYKSEPVIHGINLEADKGQILCLVGPNGAGKTTLLKCLNHLLKPTEGYVEVEGRDPGGFSPRELARTIAYVPQAGPTGFPITVFDTVLLGRRPYLNWRPKQEDIDAVVEVLERMELSAFAVRDMNQLSGGERQKAIIAKAIVQDPKIMLFDEPSTYLDLKFQLKIMQFIRELTDRKGICAIVTTHDLNLALRFSDKVAVLKNGGIALFGPPDVLTEEIILLVYDVEAHIHRDTKSPFVVPVRAVR
jgi:iron complex transport system ATP-binding protein